MKFLKRNMKTYEKLELLEKTFQELKEMVALKRDEKIVITIGSGKEAQRIVISDEKNEISDTTGR